MLYRWNQFPATLSGLQQSLAAGIALLVRSPLAGELALATACVSVPVFILIGMVTRRAGWPMTALGIAFPLLFVVFCRKSSSVVVAR